MKKVFIAAIILCVLCAFVQTANLAAAADAPGYKDPGSRVPPRTPVPAPKPKPVQKKPAPKKQVQRPAPAPKPIVTAYDRGKALFDRGLYTDAKPFLLQAVKEQPNNAYAWYYLGLFYEKTGDFANAQKNYSAAVKLDREFPIFSRVVVYPDDPHGKIPLWDSIRPMRIEKIDALGEKGVSEIPMASRNAEPAPLDRPLPETMPPAYIPPEPVNDIDDEVKK